MYKIGFESKYFNHQKWIALLKNSDWYMRIYDDYKKLIKKSESSNKKIHNDIKKEIYQFFEDGLTNDLITLGLNGPNWDSERKPVDTVVIHHTKEKPGITWQRLSAMHLVRLYAIYYYQPDEDDIKGQPIYSHHFRDGKQVFYAYHWLIRMNGDIERLLPDNETGWHSGNWDINCRSVAICLDNNFENSIPPEKVLTATSRIIKENYRDVKKENILGHKQINLKTTCPGNLFLNGWREKLLSLICL